MFTPGARAEILGKLYSSFLGNHPQLFLSGGDGKVPPHVLLSDYQAELQREASGPGASAMSSVAGNGTGNNTGSGFKEKEEVVVPGRPCTHIFKKGECCFRCKCVFPFQLSYV